jgi:hypothetical protein
MRSNSYRCLIAIAAFFGLSIEIVDINLAFLYGQIDYNIYTELPIAMFDAYLVCKLLKSLYNLKQAPRIWYETLRKALSTMSIHQLESNTSVFGKKQSHRVQNTIFVDPTLIISVHVNDILMVGLPETIKTFKQTLAKKFKIKDIGPAKDYLKIEIEQSHRGNDIRIHQNCYLKQILSKFDAANFNFIKSPLSPNVEIDLSDTKFLTNARKLLYQQKIDNLTYAM